MCQPHHLENHELAFALSAGQLEAKELALVLQKQENEKLLAKLAQYKEMLARMDKHLETLVPVQTPARSLA